MLEEQPDSRHLVVTLELSSVMDEAGAISTLEFVRRIHGKTLVVNWSSDRLVLDSARTVNIPRPRQPWLRFPSYLVFVAVTLAQAVRFRPHKTSYFPLCAPALRHQLHGLLLHSMTSDFVEYLFQTRVPTLMFKLLSPFPIKVTSREAQATFLRAGLRATVVGATPKQPKAQHYDKQELRERYGLGGDSFVVSHVGHNTEDRGLDFYIELARRNSNVVFLLVLSSRAALLTSDVPPNVRVVPRYIDDIYDIYNLSDAYVFPLRSRGGSIDSPLTVLEAAIAELPILCSDLPEMRETLAGYSQARFIAIDDAAAQAEASAHLQWLRDHAAFQR